MVDGNDKIIVESFDSLRLGSFNITDPSVKDRDVLTVALSPENTSVTSSGAATFGNNQQQQQQQTSIKNIETIHINTTGNITSISNNANLEGIKVLELAGDTVSLSVNAGTNASQFKVSKIDASGITVGGVNLNANDSATELVGGAGSDRLVIGSEGGILTGNAGGDTFVVDAARNKLVTITDIAKGDSVNFGSGTISTGFNSNKAKELTITDASDETTFVDALQKAADKETANGLYYAEFNGNTYVVANGEVGGKVAITSLNVSSIKNTFSGISGSGDGFSANTTYSGSDLATTLKLTGNLAGSGGTLNGSGSIEITMNTPFNLTDSNSSVATVQSLTAGTSVSETDFNKLFSITGVNGTAYKLSDFESVQASSVTFSGSISTSGSLNGTGNAGSTGFSTGTLTVDNSLTGILKATGDTSLTGYLRGGTLADDIIVKLAGSHTLNTEATISGDVLTFA